jgi:transcriptional regulator with XRE-family HTH domain
LTLAQKIRAIRKALGISQEEVARRSGLGFTAISRIERGVATDPHYSTLVAIAQGLGVPLAMLVDDRDVAAAEVISAVPLAHLAAPERGEAPDQDDLVEIHFGELLDNIDTAITVAIDAALKEIGKGGNVKEVLSKTDTELKEAISKAVGAYAPMA